jgi:mxaK protein
MAFSIKKMTVKHLSWLLMLIAALSAIAAIYSFNRMQKIEAFNQAVTIGKTPQTDIQSFEAKYSAAYWLAQKEYFKEATLLLTQLSQKGNPSQRAAVYHDIGNIFFLKALQIGGSNTVNERDETEYMLVQAHGAYKQALKLDNNNWGTRRNLDRVITLLPETPTPGVGESDSPGLIMGNIPVGLP